MLTIRTLKRDMRTYGIVIPSSMMATELIKVRGITYRAGSVLLLERTGEPVLVKIQRIYVVEHTKFLECPLHSLQLLYEVLKISFKVQFS
jgi:hypothetical protein